MSSANICISQLRINVMPFIQIRKKRGPKLEPYRTGDVGTKLSNSNNTNNSNDCDD